MSTIKEIARKAGVSPTTVSNVLNGNNARVSHETRSRVESILQAENYTPNMGAHILARNNSPIIGVIIFMEPRRDEYVLEDPFSSTILGAIEAEVRRHRYYLMLYNTSDKNEVLNLARAWKLSGLIMMYAPSEISEEVKKRISSPVVFLDGNFSESFPDCYNVGLEDEEGGYQIARYLLSMGHREPIFLANDDNPHGNDVSRFKGFVKAYLEQGLELGDERFIPLSKDRQERIDLYGQLMNKPIPFTAMAFSGDYYAAEAQNHLQDQGIAIPEDISIAGFDDNIYSKLVRPRLTTVHQDTDLKGRTAVDLLIRLIQDEEVAEKHVRLPTKLKIRDSVAQIF